MLYQFFVSSVCVVDVVIVVVVIVIVVVIIIINFCSKTISFDVYGSIGFKLFVRHPGAGLC